VTGLINNATYYWHVKPIMPVQQHLFGTGSFTTIVAALSRRFCRPRNCVDQCRRQSDALLERLDRGASILCRCQRIRPVFGSGASPTVAEHRSVSGLKTSTNILARQCGQCRRYQQLVHGWSLRRYRSVPVRLHRRARVIF